MLQLQCEAETKFEKVEFIADRGPDNLAYSHFYVNKQFAISLIQTEQAKKCLHRYQNSLIFVIEPHTISFKDDGIRMIPNLEELKQLTQCLRDILQSCQVKFIDINTHVLEERVKVVKNAIEKWKVSNPTE